MINGLKKRRTIISSGRVAHLRVLFIQPLTRAKEKENVFSLVNDSIIERDIKVSY
jgi:hypothetical protein